ncbi:hypothetical protein E2320_002227, partial [Naja naja]
SKVDKSEPDGELKWWKAATAVKSSPKTGWYQFIRGLNYSDPLIDNDIILVQETWTVDDLLPNGIIRARPGRGPGRLKGGQGIFISTKLRAQPTLIAPLKHIAMAHLLKLDSDLFLINVYLHPSLRKAETIAVWMELKHYVSKLLMEHPNAKVLLGGDFNARLGPDNYILLMKYHRYPPSEVPIQLSPPHTIL